MRRVFRVILAVVMIAAGVFHFVAPAVFVRMVPVVLPAPLALVLVSGFFEVLGGAGLLVERVRRAASFGLVALYVAVFPANVNMAIHHISPGDTEVAPALLWARLPFQIVFIAWALWVGRTPPLDTRDSAPQRL